MVIVADWGVLPQLIRAAAPQLQDHSHLGMQGPGLLGVILKSERDWFLCGISQF